MTGAACFGCGARDQLQEVGDTVFCPACLGRMLRRVDERTAESPGGRGRGGPIAGPADRVPAGRA
ncbi:MAG TPA: hypothetical protein VHT91_49855, partial [Kofleriaceae bacterium]|nr:hypothetical protein [Kofleriaceae bacterium]